MLPSVEQRDFRSGNFLVLAMANVGGNGLIVCLNVVGGPLVFGVLWSLLTVLWLVNTIRLLRPLIRITPSGVVVSPLSRNLRLAEWSEIQGLSTSAKGKMYLLLSHGESIDLPVQLMSNQERNTLADLIQNAIAGGRWQ